MATSYKSDFYDEMARESEASAKCILNLALDLVKPKSLVDFGCGQGIWLKEAKQRGVDQILGLDGPWVDRAKLRIHESEFQQADLQSRLSLDQRYDMALSVEVAEHLPEKAAAQFVDNLTSTSSCILFSAAIPYQGGTYHQNEQWPEYWFEFFGRNGFECLDVIRPNLWTEEKIAYYYVQNAFLYLRGDALAVVRRRADEMTLNYRTGRPLSLVHPKKYLEMSTYDRVNLRQYAKGIPKVIGSLTSKMLGS